MTPSKPGSGAKSTTHNDGRAGEEELSASNVVGATLVRIEAILRVRSVAPDIDFIVAALKQQAIDIQQLSRHLGGIQHVVNYELAGWAVESSCPPEISVRKSGLSALPLKLLFRLWPTIGRRPNLLRSAHPSQRNRFRKI